jgi:hypothetical protein
MALVIESTWQTRIPDDWTAVSDDTCVTLTPPDGTSALQISAYQKSTPVTDADLNDLAVEPLAAGAAPQPLTCGDYTGFTLAFIVADIFWRYWYLRCGPQMLFITHNCPAPDRQTTAPLITEILSHLHHRQPSPQ